MPYIPPKNRPTIDEAVDKLAKETADHLIENNIAGAISEDYRKIFMDIADYIVLYEKNKVPQQNLSKAQLVAKSVVDMAEGYNQQGGWQGELNYAITRIIQWIPFEMYRRKNWKEALRYWLYAQTVGALTRTSYAIHNKYDDSWVANGLSGVFEDIKDEYKRRVNTAYESLQIRKSGDCFEKSPFKTQLVEFEHAGVEGWIEIMLPQREPE
jgi:hypothetical protein